jgi:hypothetical protein
MTLVANLASKELNALRMLKVPKERRVEIARNAALARWAGHVRKSKSRKNIEST